MDDQNASQIFAALGHEARVRVLRTLVQAGCCGLTIGALRSALDDMPPSTFAHHLKALVGVGLVKQEKQGREILSTADYDTIRHLTVFLMEDCCKGVFETSQTPTDALEPS